MKKFCCIRFVIPIILLFLSLSSVYANKLDDTKHVVQNIPFLHGQKITLAPLSGGLTNYIYLVKSASGDKYVLRVFGDEAAALGIDPDKQNAIARTFGRLNVGPKVVYASADNKYVLFEFVVGEPLTKQAFNVKLRNKLMQKLRKLHDYGNFDSHFDPFQTAHQFRKTALHKSASIIAEFPLADMRQASNVMHTIRATLAAHSKKYMRSGHNDLHCGNILFDADRSEVSIIDLDYAGISDLFYDLAILANSLELDVEQSKSLLAAYFVERKVTERDEAHLAMMRLVSTYWNSMWYFSQVGTSTIEHNHLHDARINLQQFLQETTALAFHQQLKKLA